MLDQLLIGVALTLICILVSGLGFWFTETLFTTYQGWLMRPPHRVKLLFVVTGAGAVVLAVVLAGVAIWAWTLRWYRLFGDFETSFYYSLVSYTTVGYGDVLPAGEWRILGAMAAANGFINIGLLTTLLIRGLHYVREGYARSHEDKDDEEEKG